MKQVVITVHRSTSSEHLLMRAESSALRVCGVGGKVEPPRLACSPGGSVGSASSTAAQCSMAIHVLNVRQLHQWVHCWCTQCSRGLALRHPAGLHLGGGQCIAMAPGRAPKHLTGLAALQQGHQRAGPVEAPPVVSRRLTGLIALQRGHQHAGPAEAAPVVPRRALAAAAPGVSHGPDQLREDLQRAAGDARRALGRLLRAPCACWPWRSMTS